MAVPIALSHKTRYRYDRPVQLGPQIVRLRPAPHCRTPILQYSLTVIPARHSLHWQQDPLGNFQARLVFSESTAEFDIDVELTAEITPINPFDFFLEPPADKFPFAYLPCIARQLCPYFDPEPAGPKLASFLGEIPRDTAGAMEFLVDLNRRVRDEIAYVKRFEPGIRSCEDTLAQRQGSCRDSAWLLVQTARHLGLAARFVSGYLIQLDGEKGDSADLHAWAEVYLPGAGWVGFDPTSGLLAAEGHIPLACAREAASAAPVSGNLSVCEAEFGYEIGVRRIV